MSLKLNPVPFHEPGQYLNKDHRAGLYFCFVVGTQGLKRRVCSRSYVLCYATAVPHTPSAHPLPAAETSHSYLPKPISLMKCINSSLSFPNRVTSCERNSHILYSGRKGKMQTMRLQSFVAMSAGTINLLYRHTGVAAAFVA